MADNDEIMRILGRLEEGQERMRADFDAEKLTTRESRLRTYGKLEKIEEDVAIVGTVAAQARDKADAVEKVVVDDVKPITDDVKRMRLMGMGAIAVIGFAAAFIGVSAERIFDAIRAWLKL